MLKQPDARSSIEFLLRDMKSILLAAGIPKYQIRMRSGRHKIETCAKAFDWLHDVFMSPEYVQMNYIWSLLPKEIWERYEKFGITDTREQGLLLLAKKNLVKVWRKNRPRLFGKNRSSDNNILDTTQFDSCRL